MNIAYEITKQDFRNGNRIMIRRNKALGRSNRIFLLVVLIPALYTFLTVLRDTDLYTALYSAAISISAFCLFYFVFGRLGLALTLRALTPRNDQTGILGNHEFEMGQEWFTDRTAADETRVKWSSIVNVSLEAEYLFIYKSEISAFIIPKRAFPSPEAFEAFSAEVTGKWKNACS